MSAFDQKQTLASITERPDLIPVPAPETILALPKLGTVLSCLPVNAVGDAYHLRLAVIGAASIAVATFMVS